MFNIPYTIHPQQHPDAINISKNISVSHFAPVISYTIFGMRQKLSIKHLYYQYIISPFQPSFWRTTYLPPVPRLPS
jgi:hypothetical protein